MINITQKAQKYLKYLMSKQDKKSNLRISITRPGTEHAECKIFYDTKKIMLDQDIELKYDGFNIYVKKNIAPYLRDSKIDYIGDQTSKKLMLLAPYAIQHVAHNKIINHSTKKHVLLNQIQDFVNCNINPMLNMHGGKINLVDITETGYVTIEFLGGCNGCTMSHITLKQNIEKKILHHFPTINGICDITKHNRGLHSFYKS